jgi:uncharacterized BrkB/YihY/UPF0761 family membrane protein
MSQAVDQVRNAWRELDRARVIRTLTFWLRPAFLLRVANRFQRIAGFDRAVALASSALTALIPLAIICSSLLDRLGGKSVAERIIDRYKLTGDSAAVINDIFAPSNGASTSASVASILLLLVAVLSFTRAFQRLFEQTWELDPLSVRNTLNGLRWVAGVVAYLAVSGWIHALIGQRRLELAASLLVLPLTAVFLIWTGSVLSAHRISRRDLLPFGIVAAILTAIYSVGATVWVPHLFDSYASRYGVIGAVFAMISALFCVTVVLVGAAALGREVDEELKRIRRGERPPDHEVRREWDNVMAEARSRWAAARQRVSRH